jgi:hypothetical protein
LVGHGVEVIFDKWDLKEGQDKYAFMEKAITDPTIDKVLIICDKVYTQKANERKGGVGSETTIITPELYNKTDQEKYIPVIFEVNEADEPCIPAYIKSRIYIDLSTEDDRFEVEYEKLLRNIHNKPLYKKPTVGKKPEWLERDSVAISPLRDIIRQIRGYTGTNRAKANALVTKFINLYQDALLDYEAKDADITGEVIIKKIHELKPIRDLFLEFTESLMISEIYSANVLADFFERIYNNVLETRTENGAYHKDDFEYYEFLIWELFICVIALLMNYQRFADIYSMVKHTYFLREAFYKNARISPQSFLKFWCNFPLIEQDYKPKSDKKNQYTISGELLSQREKRPEITKQSLCNADVLLCQLSLVFDLIANENIYQSYWFPISYIYGEQLETLWIKLKSKKYCQKLLPMFGVDTIDDFKVLVKNSPKEINEKFGYKTVPTISSTIRIDDIASLP